MLNLYERSLVYPLYRHGIIVTVGYGHEPANRSLYTIMIIAGQPAGCGFGDVMALASTNLLLLLVCLLYHHQPR